MIRFDHKRVDFIFTFGGASPRVGLLQFLIGKWERSFQTLKYAHYHSWARASLLSKSGASIFHFRILYLNIEKKKNSFLYSVVFSKLFLIYNLNIKYIILRFCHYYYFFLTFLTYTHYITKKKVILCFHNIYKYANVFVFIENENTKKYYSFFIFKFKFKDIKNENWKQILKPNQFFSSGTTKNWKWKEKMILFQLTKQALRLFTLQFKMDRKQKLFSKFNLWRKLKKCKRLFSIYF